MKIKTFTLIGQGLPEELQNIPSPPKQLYCRGADLSELLKRPRVAIVGSRKPSRYGRQVTEELAGKLAERGVVIVSGLALGIDGLAHQAALEAGGQAIAVLPGPVDKVYPVTNQPLAERILRQGGALVSEYAEDLFDFKRNFIARNRLVAGLAQAVLITEAAEKSGSWYTGDFALQQNRELLAVPGNITSPASAGTNSWLKQGAAPVTSYTDVLDALDLRDHRPAREVRGRNSQEQAVLDLLLRGVHDGEKLLEQSALPISQFNQVLTMLELGGQIRALGANQWSLR